MSNDLVNKWVRREIRALSAYHVPPAAGYVKLDAMENPYHWPDVMVSEWQSLLATAELNRYPDPAATDLTTTLRNAMQVPVDAKVILGNGSDELIQMILMAVSGNDRVVLAPEPSFVMYKMIASFLGMSYRGVALCDDFSLNESAMLAVIRETQPAVIFLAYPNNPTGNLFEKQAVINIIKAAPGLVVVDEAYHAFAGDSFMSQVMQYPNLVVMRTVSKMGLAGLRLGMLAGNHDWLDEFDKVRLPYNINVLTQLSARFALQHREVLKQQTQQICQDREVLLAGLQAVPGLTVYPSRANFILFKTPTGRADVIFEGLKQRKVLIKNLNKSGGSLRDCLRVTVGAADENQQFLTALVQTLASL